METFRAFSPEAIRYLSDLKKNNTREWFAANKASYEAHLKEPGKQFAAHLARRLGALTGHSHDSKIFRINRDIRFSKDKTPYNAHFHIALIPVGRAGQPPMWFFGVSPEKLSLGCGVFQYPKDTLTDFRAAMAGPMGSDLISLSAELREKGIRIGEPELKRVPPGFEKDHPNGEALRRKGFAAWIDKDDPAFVTKADLVDRTIAEFETLLPVYHLLSQVL